MRQDYLIENLRGMCAFRDPDRRECREQPTRTIRDYCTPCLAAERLTLASDRAVKEPDPATMAEQFNQGWNARGAADIAAVESRLSVSPSPSHWLHEAIGALDRETKTSSSFIEWPPVGAKNTRALIAKLVRLLEHALKVA